jgi:predicted ATP-grasp superfamily ATP-dependent carboligase
MEQGNERLGAVILGGSFHSLGAARNLSKHAVPVYVLDNELCISSYSRSVKQYLTCPSTDDEAALVRFLIQSAAEEKIDDWVLFPSTDEYVRILAQNWEQLSDYFHLTIPSWDVVRYLYDKRLTHQLAEKSGVPTPKTYNPQNLDELTSLSFDYPVVVKPAISKHFMAVTRKKAFQANHEEDLINLFKQTATIINPREILIQELIPGRAGNLYSYVGYFKAGSSVAGLSARRSRQHPMDFGRASTFVETLDIPELEILSIQLLEGIKFTGLAEVEFMYDQKDTRFELLEVNPRIWGWHTIAIQAGLDLPYLAYADAIGLDFAAGSLREDVKWVRLVTDIPTVFQEILSGRLTLREYLKSMSGDLGFAVLSRSDPLPFIADLFLGPYNYFKNRGF